MRTALRTSIVTAALAGALLAPAAGSAFAAPIAQAVASTEAAASKAKRVALSESLVADMINSATEAPSVKVFAVLPDGTVHPKAIASLDREHTKVSIQGTTFTLTKADSAEPVLTVFESESGTTTSFPLPKGKATSPASCVSAVKTVRLGEYMSADLTMSPKGPKAFVHNLEGDPAPRTLDRTHPNGPNPDHLRIENPNGAKPVLRWKYQVGDSVALSASFPVLPKGCKLDYKTTEEQSGKPAPKPSATPAKPKTGTQTTVVPKGPVAAGAELSVENVADTDNTTTTAAAGAGLVAVFGALGASVFLRRRRAQG